ncbi:MAG: metallophosphoesterase family protein, partial [Bacteroidota bacterium]
MKLIRCLAMLVLLMGLTSAVKATVERFRLSFRDDPSTTIVIGWDQVDGKDPILYYDIADYGTDHSQYQWTLPPDRVVEHKGMSNHFVRLSNLQPDQVYYFLVRDSDGNSNRYSFRTIPSDPSTRLSIVAGGDSRSNQPARQRSNRLVAKLRPHVVLFGGDYTNGNTTNEWIAWMDDWQLSIGPDGRITPIVATRGNHEGNNNDTYNIFDVPNPKAYYALNFGGLLRTYTLNSEISQVGDQATWLADDLAANDGLTPWTFAQYHRPCRPHSGVKIDQNGIYEHWIPEFEEHGVDLVVECDAHVVKRTFPILKGTSGRDYAEGFYRNDSLGIVYIGEGTWAPLRTNNDDKVWTRNSGSFNAVKWIWVEECQVQIRTIKTFNSADVDNLTDATRFELPTNIDVWNPTNGAVIRLNNPACQAPNIALLQP